MKKLIGLILALMFVNSFAWLNENYTGVGDTAIIPTFKADSLKFTRFFRMSSYQNIRVDVMASDTTVAGFGSDSILFQWGIQTAHPALNANGLLDTVVNPERLVCDTLTRAGGTFTNILVPITSSGIYSHTFKLIDTTNVLGFAYQTANPAPEWDVLYRVWVKGLTGNKVGAFLRCRINVLQRVKGANE